MALVGVDHRGELVCASGCRCKLPKTLRRVLVEPASCIVDVLALPIETLSEVVGGI